MKTQFLLLVLLILSGFVATAGTFDFVIATSKPNEKFAFYIQGAKNFNIDWGDGELLQMGLRVLLALRTVMQSLVTTPIGSAERLRVSPLAEPA